MKKLISFLAAAMALCICSQAADAASPKGPTLAEAKDSLQTIVKNAQEGDAYSQNEVGNWYYTGKHVTQDYKEAVQWYTRAAKQNYPQAIGNLGLCYQTGNGVAPDSIKAVKLFDRSLETGKNNALFNLCLEEANKGSVFYNVYVGHCYEEGIAVKKNPLAAVPFYEAAASKGSVDAMTQAGIIYLNDKKFDKAYRWFSKGAKLDNMVCTFWAGRMLMEGRGVAQDQESGFNMLFKAANQDFPAAMYEVAVAYYDGRGTVANNQQAAIWLQKAASIGYEKAMFRLAQAYVTGDGVEVNYDEATLWFAACNSKFNNSFKKLFEAGADLNGSPYHQYLLGLKSYKDKDYDEAMKYFKDLSKAKNVDGMLWEAYVLATPEYKKHNLKKGLRTLNEAAEAGNALANYLLAMHYATGSERDANKAVSYLRVAAGLNYGPALCYLGDMYYEGRDVVQSYAEAFSLYNKAKAVMQLTPSAQKRLADCYERGLGGLTANKDKAAEILKLPAGSVDDLLRSL